MNFKLFIHEKHKNTQTHINYVVTKDYKILCKKYCKLNSNGLQ